jgi:hypothetical protein
MFSGFAVILAVLAIATWSSLATPARSWDGMASWGLRAEVLGSPADLGRPFFSDPRVYAHSRSYPLLQPLVVASMASWMGPDLARMFYPMLFAALLLLVGMAGRRCGLSCNNVLFLVVAIAVTPLWNDVGPGSIDSGIGDLFVSYALSLGAIGLLRRETLPLALACLILPWIKPEGTVFALLLILVTAWECRPRLHRVSTLALCISLALWLPLRNRLNMEPVGLTLWVGPVLLAVSLVGGWGLERIRSARGRTVLVLGVVILTGLGTWLAGSWLATSSDPILGAYVGQLSELPSRITSLPGILVRFLGECFAFKRFGLVFLLLPIALFHRSLLEDGGDRSLARFLGLSLILAFFAILLGPAHDRSMEFSDRLVRFLLGLVALSWLLILLRLSPQVRSEAEASGSTPSPD